jgi:ABC-type nitrate/sulfonate/bicarbonate transport system substrate-binding protein
MQRRRGPRDCFGALRCGLLVALALGAACGTAGAPSGASPPAGGGAPAGAAPAPTTAAAEPRTLQMGAIAFNGYYYPLWAAMHEGPYRDLGLVVEWNALQTNEAISALVSGGIDVLQAPTDAAITALSKGAPLRLVADHTLEAPYDLVARADVGGIADLRGLKVGVSSLRAGSGTVARVMLRAGGLADEDYELTQAGGNPQRYAALQVGGVQASILSDPVNFLARQEGYSVLQSFSDVVPEYSFVSWWVRADWLESAANRAALVDFLAGMIRGRDWAHAPANREALLALWMEQTRVERPIAEQMYDYYVVRHPTLIDTSDVRPAPVGAVVQIMRDLEDLPPLPPETQWIDRGPAERARQVAAGRP